MSEKQPRCRIFRDWHEMLKPLHERAPQKWLRFFNATMEYVYHEIVPDFSDDDELAALWQRTNARPYDSVNDKPGWIRTWKRRRSK